MTTLALRRRLAAKAYARTAAYDAAISNWFARELGDDAPDYRAVGGRLIEKLRYGENPHQSAAFYRTPDVRFGVATARQAQGKQLSYNNINDTDAAYECVAEFDPARTAACAIIKHANPCGVAEGGEPDRGLSQGAGVRSDLGLRRHRRAQPHARCGRRARHHRDLHRSHHRARRHATKPSPSSGRRRICGCSLPAACPIRARRGSPQRPSPAALLVQSRDNAVVDDMDLKAGDQTRADQCRAARPALRLPRRQARQVEHHRLCQGSGDGRHRRRTDEPDRFRAHCRAQGAGCRRRRPDSKEPATKGSVVASDAFFPFADGLLVAIEAGATAVIQPGGSVRDDEVIKAADDHGIAMVVTGTRHFRH